jgi:orotate phosphoribosyltransferase
MVGVTDRRARILELVRARGYVRREEPFQLSSGAWSHDYIDGKKAVGQGSDLAEVAAAIIDLAKEAGADFDAVGGLTMGADPFAHAVAVISGKRWFSVRKEQKAHGKQQLIEGAGVAPGEQVLLVDDVISTGASLLQALDAVEAAGASVVLATCLVDRGDAVSKALAGRGIDFRPLLTYRDLGIDPV